MPISKSKPSKSKKQKLRLYNTLTRRKEKFKAIKPKFAGIYSCGPTTYDYAHIGNLRTYIFNDILKRVLLYNGYEVKHVMNITDVDDKTIKRSYEENLSLKEFTRKYEKIFFDDLASLNIISPDIKPRATEHITEMVELIKKLLKKGFAYKTDDGIYYDVSKFKGYGKLSKLKLKKLKSRVKADQYEKQEASDFSLWKFWDERDRDVFWKTEIGKGRPGWHIECSAMSMRYLGGHFDIHTGAIDLIFPHHENEIAQSEAAAGKKGRKFVNYWLHAGFLVMPEGKMAKSLGNIITIQALKDKNFAPLDYRYLCLTTHYRSELVFSWQNLQNAKNSYQALKNKVLEIKQNLEVTGADAKKIKQEKKKFTEIINDDLDMPKALAYFHNMLKSEELKNSEKYALLLDFDRVFGLGLDKVERKKVQVPEEIEKLIQAREQARKKQDWKLADKLREEIKEKGFWVDDTPQGAEVRRL